jgi:hypothetical protein
MDGLKAFLQTPEFPASKYLLPGAGSAFASGFPHPSHGQSPNLAFEKIGNPCNLCGPDTALRRANSLPGPDADLAAVDSRPLPSMRLR